MINQDPKDFILDKVSKLYIEGKITLSEAARNTDITLWEMEKYLVDKGFKSSYSIDDLETEMKLLEKI